MKIISNIEDSFLDFKEQGYEIKFHWRFYDTYMRYSLFEIPLTKRKLDLVCVIHCEEEIIDRIFNRLLYLNPRKGGKFLDIVAKDYQIVGDHIDIDEGICRLSELNIH